MLAAHAEDFILPPPSYCPCAVRTLLGLSAAPRLADLAIDWRLKDLRPPYCPPVCVSGLRPADSPAAEVPRRVPSGSGCGCPARASAERNAGAFQVDLFVPVPLHPVRSGQGFNQSQALALGIKSHWHRQIFRGVVRRRKPRTEWAFLAGAPGEHTAGLCRCGWYRLTRQSLPDRGRCYHVGSYLHGVAQVLRV